MFSLPCTEQGFCVDWYLIWSGSEVKDTMCHELAIWIACIVDSTLYDYFATL